MLSFFINYVAMSAFCLRGKSFNEDRNHHQCTIGTALSEVYPNLYRIARRKKSDTMANVLWIVPLNVSFRRGLVNTNLNYWYDLVSKVVPVSLTSVDLFGGM